MHIAQRVYRLNPFVLALKARPGVPHGSHHTRKCPKRESSQGYIVQQDEDEEDCALANRPWFVATLTIEAIEDRGSSGINNGDRYGPRDVQKVVI